MRSKIVIGTISLVYGAVKGIICLRQEGFNCVLRNLI